MLFTLGRLILVSCSWYVRLSRPLKYLFELIWEYLKKRGLAKMPARQILPQLKFAII
jgi:hypothetical protein